MLYIFVLGMTPKLLLHDIFASHVHLADYNSEKPEVLPKGFQCDVNSLVANLPFINVNTVEISPAEVIHQEAVFETLYHFYYSSVFSDYTLRGPPIA